MHRLQKLTKRRNALLDQLQSIVDDAGNDLTANEQAEFDAIKTKISNVDAELAEAKADLERRTNAPPLGDLVGPGGANGHLPDIINAQPTHTTQRQPTFQSLFPNVALSCGPFKDPDDFWRSFMQRDRFADDRFFEMQAAQTTAVDSEGGVSMPTSVVRSVVDTALETSIVMSRAALVRMLSEKTRVWAFDGQSVSGGTLYGNASAQWVAEGEQATAVALETKKIELTARKLFLLVEETREIVESGPGFSAELEATIGRAMAWHADDAYLHGNGVGKPQGALTSANPARIAVARQGAGAIDSTDILAMAERMHPSLFNEAIWITSNPCLDQLASAHVAGTNSDHFLFAPSEGAGLPNTLLGRPIILSEKSPNLGTEADLALVAFSGYAVGLRQQVQIDSSLHVGFAKDVVTLRGLMRTDGQSRWLAPFQPKDSNSATLSWCVVLTDAA